MIGNMILVDARARCGPGALKKLKILQQKRHTGERAVWQPPIYLPLCIVMMFYDDRVDLRINFAGSHNGFVEQFACGDVLFPDQVRKAHRVIVAVFFKSHGDVPRC